MNKFYEVLVTKTGKAINSKKPAGEGWETFDRITKRFKTTKETKEWLHEEYGNCKRKKIYVDTIDEKAKHIGYIYCFKNRDISHNSESWYQQDWIDIEEMRATRILVK